MDLTETIAPRSDQLNADDLIAGPMTITVTEVRAGNPEQPVSILTAETPGRPYKPSKSMRRVLVTAWGADSSAYTGRRITLYRNPQIKFGGDAVGGIEISHLSHIAKRISIALTVTRGKKKAHTVDPLPDLDPTAVELDALRAEHRTATPERQAEIMARVAEIRGQ